MIGIFRGYLLGQVAGSSAPTDVDFFPDLPPLGGIYDATRADNPFAIWTHVVVPVCTGFAA